MLGPLAVHALTASGAVVGLLAILAASRGDLAGSASWMLLALAIDGVDGSLARWLQVARRLPWLDGRRLDDIVDYLNYVVVPACFLVEGGLVHHWGFVAPALLASAFGFSRVDAKTPDHFFLGFPSYWNVVALYAWLLEVSPPVTEAWLLGLAAAVFVPLRYVYPSRMARLGRSTQAGAVLWLGLLLLAVRPPAPGWRPALAWGSLLYPAWYLLLSLWLGGIQRQGSRQAHPSKLPAGR